MSDFQKLMVALVVICVGVGSFTASMLYGEDWRQGAVLEKAIACEEGTDDAVLYGLGVVSLEWLKNFSFGFLWTGIIAALVASRLPWLIVCGGLLAAIFVSDVSIAWMFPIILGGTFGTAANIITYGWVGKRRRHRLAQRA